MTFGRKRGGVVINRRNILRAILCEVSHKGQMLNNHNTEAKFLDNIDIKAREQRMALSYFWDLEQI